jgi:hypothetical protein
MVKMWRGWATLIFWNANFLLDKSRAEKMVERSFTG